MEKYDNAAVRHLEDATILNDLGRVDNAGHLIGFAAECAIKHSISTLRPAPHGHLPAIINAAKTHLNNRSTMFQILKQNDKTFNDWSVNRRYCETGNKSTNEIKAWFSATKRLFAAAGLKAHK